MNPFSVEWLPAAEDELARIWVQAVDRRAVTAAQAEIDRRLSRDPLGNGYHLAEGLYRITVLPLNCTYTVNAARRHVQVTWVWHTP